MCWSLVVNSWDWCSPSLQRFFFFIEEHYLCWDMQQHNLNSPTNIWQKNQIETKTNNNQSKQTQKTKDVQHRPYQKHRLWHMSALFPKLKEKKSIKILFIFRILCEFFWTKFKRLDLINMTYMYFTLKYLLYMPLLQLFYFFRDIQTFT